MTSSTASASLYPRGQGELVLVVDDEESILRVTRLMLEFHGYRVLTACDGEAALRELRTHRGEVRLVIADLMMPRMNGIQLAHELGRLAPGLPVLAASAAGWSAMSSGAATLKQILHKPWTMQALLCSVRDALAPLPSSGEGKRCTKDGRGVVGL